MPPRLRTMFLTLMMQFFYEVVMEARETTDAYPVTGNIKHFPVKPYVVTPKEMLEILNENER